MDELDKLQEAKWASTVDVYIQVSYTKILDIDTINQRFQAEAIIESKWYDPNIQSLEEPIDASKIWKPDLYIENAINEVKEEVTYKVIPNTTKDILKESHRGQQFLICEMRKARGTFYESLELQSFPLDVQDLTLTVATKKPGTIVNFKLLQKDVNSININNTLDKSMWHMHTILLTRKDKIHREYSYGKRDYPAVRVSAKVFRQPGFFYWNALLPILLVTLASLAPFVVDVQMPQSRMPSTATLLLTSVGIRWTIGRFVPTVSYLTSLDKYSLAGMMIITTELLYHAIMGAIFPKIQNKTVAYSLDKVAFGIFCSIIICKQLAFVFWVIKVTKYRNQIRQNKIIKLNEDDSSDSSSDESSAGESSDGDLSEYENEEGTRVHKSKPHKNHKNHKNKKFNLLSLRKKSKKSITTTSSGDDAKHNNDTKLELQVV